MKTKKIRITVDVLMVILFITLMLNQLTGVFAHEVLGILTFVLFITHHVLNGNFYKTMFKGKLSKLRVAFLITDILLFIMMIIMVFSSFLISQHIFSFLGVTKHMLGRMLHILSAYSIYLLSALHLGLHYNVMVKLKKDKKIILNVFLIIFAIIFGINGFIKKQFINKLTLQNMYPLYSDDNPLIILIDYLGIFIMFVMIGYAIYNLLMLKKKSKGEN